MANDLSYPQRPLVSLLSAHGNGTQLLQTGQHVHLAEILHTGGWRSVPDTASRILVAIVPKSPAGGGGGRKYGFLD